MRRVPRPCPQERSPVDARVEGPQLRRRGVDDPAMAFPLPAARRAPDLLRRLLGAAWALLGALGEALLSLLAPACCAACDEPLGPRVLFCPVCASSLVPLDPPAERGATESPPGGLAIVAYGGYGGALAEALQRFKYRARPDLARALGELARRAAEQAGLAAECVVPVPLHPRRLGERGYNQAALVARAVARSAGGCCPARSVAPAPPGRRPGSIERRAGTT
jgi:hypothetical protein